MSAIDADELHIVPGERHVERLVREGKRAETRTALRSRLAAGLLPEIAFASFRECRLVLAMALAEEAGTSAGQLDLFGLASRPGPDGSPRAAEKQGDALLSAVRARGGASWARMVVALDEAIGGLRARGATPEHLERVGKAKGFLATRARTLAGAMRALDARLARAGARDDRLVGSLIAQAILEARAEDLEALVGAHRLRARWLLAWEPSELAWWRALDDKLAPRGGGAKVVLPSFDRPLAGARERDPLDTLAEEITRGLDASTESEKVEAVLGDLTGAASGEGNVPPDGRRVRLVSTSDAAAQASAVVEIVSEALRSGVAVERIVLALPVLDERTLGPLRLALEAAGIVAHDARGAPPSETPAVGAALLALDAATSLDRHTVARLLCSGWVDAARVSSEGRREAERRLARLARSLESSATVAGEDAAVRLVRTATTPVGGPRGPRRDEAEAVSEHVRDVDMATRVVALLDSARSAATRLEHVRAARTLWAELGIGARAGRGGLATFASDAVPVGVPRAERLAIARDARAWDALVSALDLYETTAHRVGALEQRVDAPGFRLELVELLDALVSQPGGGRAGAVRIARLADVAGDALDLLVVLDANDGVLPRDDAHDALVSESLAEAIARASQGAYTAPTAGATRARELSALAVAASDASSVVLAFTREDGAGGLRVASQVVDALERAGLAVVLAAVGAPHDSGQDVSLRIAREREREAFFLDPARPRSAVVGDLLPSAEAANLLVGETGGAERALAVTGLERLARCAFHGFAHVVLGARETELREELPDAREEGTLVHEALAAAFVATQELWPRRPRARDVILGTGAAAAEAVLERWQGHAPLRAVVRLRVGDAVRAVLRVAIDDDAWDFSLAEQAFGARSGGSWPAFELVEDELRLTLRGSIDRVDQAHDGRRLKVIDYKRSKSTVQAAASGLGESALQVPLYACVTSRTLGLPSTGAYVPTHARDVALDKPSAKTAARMDELVARLPGARLAEIERRALAIVAGIRAGGLLPIPQQESECRFCAVSGGCRKPRFAMAPNDDGDDEPAWKTPAEAS